MIGTRRWHDVAGQRRTPSGEAGTLAGRVLLHPFTETHHGRDDSSRPAAGHRHRHLGHQDAAVYARRHGGRHRDGGARPQSAPPGLVRAGPGAVVVGDAGGDAGGGVQGGGEGRGRDGRRAIGSDARRGVFGSGHRTLTTGDPLERSADGQAVRPDRGPGGRAGSTDRDGGQPGTHGVHRAQDAVGSRARTGGMGSGRGMSCCPRTTFVCE